MTRRTAPTLLTGTSAAHAGTRRGFTLLELLVVVVIIGVLAGILLVSFSGVLRGSRNASAENTLRAVGQAIDAFNTDLSYLPPLLVVDDTGWNIGEAPGNNSRLVVPEFWDRGGGTGEPSAAQIRNTLESARYASEYSIAAYLMGAGNIDGVPFSDDDTGANTDDDDGKAGPGFRNPGPDRSWGGAADRSAQTEDGPNPRATRTGRVYGPYLDQNAMADRMELDRRAGGDGFGLYKLLDPWGQPIRYYTGWPTKTRPGAGGAPEISVAFTPVELRTADAVSNQIATGGTGRALDYDREVLNASFALVSAGAPRILAASGPRQGLPLPLFGERRRSSPQAALANLSDLGTFVQDLGASFDPASLSEVDQSNLLDDLSDNVRYMP